MGSQEFSNHGPLRSSFSQNWLGDHAQSFWILFSIVFQENWIRSCLLSLLALNTDDPISDDGNQEEIDFFYSYFDENHTVSFVSCIIFFRHEKDRRQKQNPGYFMINTINFF